MQCIQVRSKDRETESRWRYGIWGRSFKMLKHVPQGADCHAGQPAVWLRDKKGEAIPTFQTFEGDVKHHVRTHAADCFWMHLAGTFTLNVLSKYAKGWMERGDEECLKKAREQRGAGSGLSTPRLLRPRPKNYQPSDPAKKRGGNGVCAWVCLSIFAV